MDAEGITTVLADVLAESDPTLKGMKMASLCSAVFREQGIEVVVVGGSAKEAGSYGAGRSGGL